MKKLKQFCLLLAGVAFLAAGTLVLPGCASSSSALRYASGKKADSPKENKVRYEKDSEENDLAENSVSSQPDSLNDFYATQDEFDEDFTEKTSVNVEDIINKFSKSNNSSSIRGNIQEKLLMEIIKYLKTPYKYGGNSMDGIDCSAFTQSVYRNTFSYPLLRSAREQYTQGSSVEDRSSLKFGDLIFFNTRRRVRPGHVAIYIGGNYFAHASSKYGVRISSLDEDYYSRKFMGGRRIENLFTTK